MHPRQPLTSLFLWVDDGQAGSNPKVRLADYSRTRHPRRADQVAERKPSQI